MSNDKAVAIKGGVWTSVSTIVTVLTQFIRLMILTRFLDKSDFGLVAIINTVIGLCLTFTDLGFSSAIMYKKEITNEEYSTLFWVQLFIFTIIYFLLWLTSPFVANFYNEPQLVLLIPIASLTVLFQAFGKLYDTVLQKRYHFKTIAYRNILANIISLIIAVYLAIEDFGVYSLVLSTLAYTLILNVWNFISGVKMQKLVMYCNPLNILQLLKIGLFQTGTRILDFLSNKVDVMIIGKLLGIEVLGVYDLAKNIVNTLVDLVRTVVSKVALPILSNNNDKDEVVKSHFFIMTKVVAYICIPICVSIAIFSKEIIHIVYGSAYTDASVIVSIFAFISIFTSISSFFDMLGIAKGRTDLNFYNTIVRVLITTPIVYLSSIISIDAVAYGQLIATVFQTIVFWFIVVKNTYPVSVKDYFSLFYKWLLIQVGCFIVMKIFMTNIVFPTICFKSIVVYAIVYLIVTLLAIGIFLRKDIEYFKVLFYKYR